MEHYNTRRLRLWRLLLFLNLIVLPLLPVAVGLTISLAVLK